MEETIDKESIIIELPYMFIHEETQRFMDSCALLITVCTFLFQNAGEGEQYVKCFI